MSNVKMQDNVVFTNLDIFAQVGANAALIKGADVTVTNWRNQDRIRQRGTKPENRRDRSHPADRGTFDVFSL